ERSDERDVELPRFQLDHGTRPLARTQKNVSANREKPAAAVASRQVRMPRPEGAEEGVLDHVVGVRFVARQGERESIDIVDPRNRFALEGDGLFQRSLSVWHASNQLTSKVYGQDTGCARSPYAAGLGATTNPLRRVVVIFCR